MSYFYSKDLTQDFETVVNKVKESLPHYGFGVLTEIDIKGTLKKKINEDIQDYTILGACNPKFAYQAIQNDEHIGLMLPCNILVQKKENSEFVNVSVINPVETIGMIKNNKLEEVAKEVNKLLKEFLEHLN